jgi:hypothetical protein
MAVAFGTPRCDWPGPGLNRSSFLDRTPGATLWFEQEGLTTQPADEKQSVTFPTSAPSTINGQTNKLNLHRQSILIQSKTCKASFNFSYAEIALDLFQLWSLNFFN